MRKVWLSIHNATSRDSWQLSANYKWLYKYCNVFLVFFGKFKIINIPYWFKKNKNLKESKRICEQAELLRRKR